MLRPRFPLSISSWSLPVILLLVLAIPKAGMARLVTGPYIMAFHACDTATTNCMDIKNDQVYLAQSADGVSWTRIPGLGFTGSVPDVVQRGNTLYIYSVVVYQDAQLVSGKVAKYHLDTDTLELPVAVNVTGLPDGFVDPSPTIDDQGRIVLFFLQGIPPGQGPPASCPTGQTTCSKHFQSATEVAGSDGTQFTLDDGDRATVNLPMTNQGSPMTVFTASDPAIFYDGHQYVLYISYASSVSVWTSPALRGTYTPIQSLPGSLLNISTGGVPSGYFDPISQMYWTYTNAMLQNGLAVILRAVHPNLSHQLTASDWTTVVSGSSIGFTATTTVESPGFKVLTDVAIPAASLAFAIRDRGGTTRATRGAQTTTAVGYGLIQPAAGNTTPSGIAIYGYRPGNYLVGETSVPAAAELTSGRIYAEVNGLVNTGIAIANPNNQTATISFFYTDSQGNDLGSGSSTITANSQIAKFLDASPFKTFSGTTFEGTFSFSSSVPLGVLALRSRYNERGDFLTSTLPVINISAPANSGGVVLPHFSDGAGWTTGILLVNPTNNSMSGNIEFHNDDGSLANVTVGSQTASTFPYSVPPRASQKLMTAGVAATTTSGSVRIIPTGAAAPSPSAVFGYKAGGITVSEAGVSVTSGTAFRVYVESSGTGGQPGNIQSGIAIVNNSSNAAGVMLELTGLDGVSTGLTASLSLPGFGHTAKFLAEFFQNQTLPDPFQGVLRITTTSSGISVVGLRSRYNENGDFLITTTPPTNETAPANSTQLLFPQLVDGGGYTTQFILFSGSSGQTSSGHVLFLDPNGQPLSLGL